LNNLIDNDSWQDAESIFENLLETQTDVKLFDYLRSLKDLAIDSKLYERIYYAVRSGNLETAGYLTALANKNGGYGYNKVHEDVLTQ